MSDEQRSHPDHPFRLGGAFGTGRCCDVPGRLHWTDYALEIERLQARLAAAEATISALRAAFIKHRTATHEVKPKFCVTCRESDAILAATAPEGEG
jgi:hypothetical protein